jgi:hypothetical protein
MLNPKPRFSDATVAVLAALAVLSLAACGGDAPSITGPSVDAEATVILSATLDDVGAGTQRVLNVNLPHAGALVLTVRWTDQNNTVSAVLTGASCPAFPDAAHCQGLRSVEREAREGREGVIDQPRASGAYLLLLHNEGPGTESIHVTGVLTSPTPTPYPTPNPYRTSDPRRQ